MSSKILTVCIKDERGGSIYEEEVKAILQKSYNVETLELDTKKNKWLIFGKLKFYYQLKTYRHYKKYDILLANKVSVYSGIPTKYFNKKILVVHHYSINENPYPVIRNIIHKRFFSRLNDFDTIVVVADYWKQFIEAHINTKLVQVKVIRNSFNVELLQFIQQQINKAAFIKKYSIPEDKIIVYAGNALKIKGYTEVIKHLNSKKYFIITSGAKEGAVNHLHLNLSYAEYIQLLCIADVTIILSRLQEGWNRIAHESLVCGTPVIGTEVAGLGELLHNSGQLIFKDGDNLDHLIETVKENEQIIVAGRSYVEQFNVDYFTKEWIDLLGKHANE